MLQVQVLGCALRVVVGRADMCGRGSGMAVWGLEVRRMRHGLETLGSTSTGCPRLRPSASILPSGHGVQVVDALSKVGVECLLKLVY